MSDVEFPKGSLEHWPDLVQQIGRSAHLLELFDGTLDPEVQTDKGLVKVLPCQFCKRPLIVSTFYVLAWAKCSPCKGQTASDSRSKGSVEVVQAGRTDPALAKDLTKTLINPQFANALCPVHPDDDDHVMELKSVHHNDNYGPGHFNAKNVWVRHAPGEVVMHQCKRCRAVVTYSTAVMVQFRRCNEEGPRNEKSSHSWLHTLGVREEPEGTEEVA